MDAYCAAKYGELRTKLVNLKYLEKIFGNPTSNLMKKKLTRANKYKRLTIIV
jgi:hypothetical protein